MNGGYYNSYIINEDGSILQEFTNASGLYLSELPNAPKKIFAFIHQNQGGLNINNFIYVYGFDQNFSTSNFHVPQITICPNPTSDFLTFKSPNDTIVKAIVYDLQAKIVKQFESQKIESIDLKDISAGEYFVKLINSKYIVTDYKLIKN